MFKKEADMISTRSRFMKVLLSLMVVLILWFARPCHAQLPAGVRAVNPAATGGNGNVNIDDLLAVINGWGMCL